MGNQEGGQRQLHPRRSEGVNTGGTAPVSGTETKTSGFVPVEAAQPV